MHARAGKTALNNCPQWPTPQPTSRTSPTRSNLNRLAISVRKSSFHQKSRLSPKYSAECALCSRYAFAICADAVLVVAAGSNDHASAQLSTQLTAGPDVRQRTRRGGICSGLRSRRIGCLDRTRAVSGLQEASFPQRAAPDRGLNDGFHLGEEPLELRRIVRCLRLLHQRADLRKCFTRAHVAAAVEDDTLVPRK